MKRKSSLLLLALLCLLASNAQQQFSIGVPGVTETFHDVKVDPNDGGTIYAGSVTNGGTTDCYLVKLNAAQQVVWQRTIQNAGNDVLYRVRVCANGDYIAAGRFTQTSTSNTQPRGLVIRVNPANGNIIWATTTNPLNSTNGDALYDLIELNNQNIAAVGSANFISGAVNSMVLLLAANGTEITKTISTIGSSDEIENIAQIPNGNLVVCGHNWVGAYDAFIFELNSATLAIVNQFSYQVNINVPGVNPSINTLWPSRSHVVGNNVMIDMVGATGTGTGSAVQFVYTYTPGAGTLTGNYHYHNNNSGSFTLFPLAANDYIITQSNGAAAQYVSRVTNGAMVYDRQIGNNRTSNIGGSDISGTNLALAGSTPGGDGYMLFSNPNFPLSANPCPITAANILVTVPNTPTNVNATHTMNVNPVLCAQFAPNPNIPNNPLTGLCCPANTTSNVTKCDIADVVLTASAGVSYAWTPATGLSSTTVQNPTCSVMTNTSYTVTITDANGCVFTNVFNVTVNTDCHCEDPCSWSLTGNSIPNTWNFIGTLNNMDFKVRTNSVQRMVVSAAGNVGIGTPAPAKPLHVNGEARIGVLPPASPNESVVFANASGDLRALAATGNTNHYLSGNGTWQTLPTGGGTIGADQGLTIDGNGNVVLGSTCNRGLTGGEFLEHRVINMNSFNLYFNSPEEGKLFMGYSAHPFDGCRDLYTRLEISSAGISGVVNDYASPNGSTSGLRFTDLTALERPIANRYKGVLSLDEEGDVIWVEACCPRPGGGIEDGELKTILNRLDKLEKEVRESRAEATTLKSQLTQIDVLLTRTNSIVLNQNVPNPFAENTVITYYIPNSFQKAQLVFNTVQGETIKTIDIRVPGKGQVNVFASDISSGLYFYTLVVDGKQIERKKMIKQ